VLQNHPEWIKVNEAALHAYLERLAEQGVAITPVVIAGIKLKPKYSPEDLGLMSN